MIATVLFMASTAVIMQSQQTNIAKDKAIDNETTQTRVLVTKN
jgi:hypothetical protein